MFETEVIREKIYCIEESASDIVGTFRRLPQRFGARENLLPFPFVTPLVT